MKKYITLAALLAAGTACANAAETETVTIGETIYTITTSDTPTWTATFGSEYGEIGYTTDLQSAGTFWDAGKLAVEGGAQTKSDGRIHMAGGNYGAWDNDFNISFTATLTGDTFTAGHIAEFKAGSTSDWVCIGINANGELDLTGNKVSAVDSNGRVSLNTEYVFDFYTFNGNVFLTVGDATLTATLGAVSGTIDNIALGGNTGSDRRVSGLFSEISNSGITYTAVAVPEPSAFGLLAGVGALALVASRRRRK